MTELWCNGRWLPAGEFSISATDRGWLHGHGLFETMLAVDGRIAFAERHQARLAEGCRRLGWVMELPEIREVGGRLLMRNGMDEGRARVRLAVTAGSGGLGDAAAGADARMVMTVARATAAAGSVAVEVSPWVRNERSALAGLKCASYAENLVALAHAAKSGFQETLFFNTRGKLAEAATANVFLVMGGRLFTPSLESGCLPGIARGVVLELASEAGIAAEETLLDAGDLEAAEGLFLTSVLRGIMPVRRVKQRVLAECPVSAVLAERWNARLAASFPPTTTF